MKSLEKAITALQICLNSDTLSLSLRGKLANRLSIAVLEITKNPKEAKYLLTHEQEKIQIRGNEFVNYLLEDNVLLENVLKRYYQCRFLEHNNQLQMLEHVTISELMLMLGTFVELQREMLSNIHRVDLELEKIRDLKKVNEMLWHLPWPDNQNIPFYEDLIMEEKQDQRYLYHYYQEQIEILLKGIFRALGTTKQEFPLEQTQQIKKASWKLAYSHPFLRDVFSARRKKKMGVMKDISFLMECGERPTTFSPFLQSIDGKVDEKQKKIGKKGL